MRERLPASEPPPDPAGRPTRVILLVSGDLFATSRIAGLAGLAGARLETLRSLDDALPGDRYDLVLLDLQGMTGDPAVLVATLAAKLEPLRTATGTAIPVVGFGPHVAKDRLAAAEAAGAKAAVSRGELLGGFAVILDRFCA